MSNIKIDNIQNKTTYPKNIHLKKTSLIVGGAGGKILVTSAASRTSYMAYPACGEGGVDKADYS